MRCVFAVVLLAVPAAGQHLGPGQVRERYDKGLPLWKVEYKVDDKGELSMCPSPMTGDDAWFGPAFNDDPHFLRWGGQIHQGHLGLNIILMGSRDLASLGDPVHGLTLMGPLPDVATLRQRIALPVEEETADRARRAALERLLAVRWIQEHAVQEARGELTALVKDAGADRFLRRAAADALRALDGKRPPPADVADGILAAVPTGADLVVFIDNGCLPAPFFLPRVARRVGMEMTYRTLMDAGGAVSRATMAGGQFLADTVSMVPFEFARRYGNARFDRIVGAVKIVDRRPAVWLDAQGMFEPDGLARLMVVLGGAAEVEGGRLAAELPGILKATADRNHLRIVDPGVGKPGGAANAARLRAAGLGKGAPVWVYVPENSSLLDFDLPLPMPKSAVLEVTFERGLELALSCPFEREELATRMVVGLESLRILFERRLAELKKEDERLAPVVDPLVAALRAAKIEAQGKLVTIAAALRGLDPDHLPPLIVALL